VQTNAVDKSNDSARLIGNATDPELGTLLDTFLGVPIAPNTNTDWSRLPHFEWATVDQFAEAMAVLCAVTVHWRTKDGTPMEVRKLLTVVGSRDDLVKWFRQIPLYSGDQCLQCYHWDGQCIVDMHVQMGRQSSADGAQRLSMIASAIAFEAVEEEIERRLQDEASEPKALWDVLRRIVDQRRSDTQQLHTGLWILGIMQDDLGYVAITQTVGDITRTTIPKVLHEYGIEVSMDKRREDEAVVEGPQPNPRTLFISADFDATKLEAPGHRGQDKSIKRFDEVVEAWSRYPPGRLVPLGLFE